MKTFRIIGFALVAILLCLTACGGGDNPIDPIDPTPTPEVIKSEITIDSSILTKGLSFTHEKGEQSISFSTNESWTLSMASTTSGATWCTASATSGAKGTASVKFSVVENTSYDNRSVSVTIKSGTATKTFTISQKGVDAMLVTTDKYEISQEGGTIDIEVKTNVSYKMEISESAKSWITEASARGLTTYKHSFNIAMNEENEKREGEVYFKSGDKVETVKIYQAGGAILLLSQNEYNVSDKGETISVDIRSNIEFGVQMPDVDWIVDEASSRGLSSHTLKYVVKANEGYDARSASIVFFDKNSELKDTLVVNQAQKDAIVVSEKNISVAKEGGIVEVKVASNVDFEVQIPSEATWITKADSRALKEKSVYLKVAENTGEDRRNAIITFTNKDSQISECIAIEQAGAVKLVVTLTEAGTMKELLGSDYLDITSLKVEGPINGDDVRCLRQMLGGFEFKFAECGKLRLLDMSETSIVKGGGSYLYYYGGYYTSNDVIGSRMFYDCVNIQNIVLPTSITSIGSYAFSDCSSMTSINIPAGVTSIGENAFYGCNSFKSVYITDLSAWFNITFNNFSSTPLYNGAKLYLNNQELSELVIPEEITEIKSYAFSYCFSLNSVTMGAGVVSIGESAFWRCSSLTSIDIPDSVTTIGSGAFCGCSSLISIEIPANVNSISTLAFSDCSSLTSIDLPVSITSIGSYAFSDCSSLISIEIPAGVTSIGSSAFSGCSSLTSINIPTGVTSISSEVFLECSSLVSIEIPANVTSIGDLAFKYCSSLTSINIPADVTSIGSSAFYGCSSLTSINIPAGVASIGNNTFYICSSLTSIVIPDIVTSIGDWAFGDCSSLTSINIPASVTSIGNYAFVGCSSLKSLHITDLSAWCNITFSAPSSNPLNRTEKLYLNNNELTELVIPAEVKQIKDYAFYGYKSLKKVTMSDGVASVSKSAFYGCSSLSSVIFSATITSVGIHSFRNCSSLLQVTCQGTTPPTINPSSTNSSFNGSNDKRTLYVSKGCVSAYQSSDWASFFGTIKEMD